MPVKKKPQVSRHILARAREVLAFAEQRAGEVADRSQLWNALYSPDGKASLAFETEAERAAFCKTPEYKRILALMDTLPPPPVIGHVDIRAAANGKIATGTISLEVPRSVHAALLEEARAEGVSLNQLCVAKLVAQLRAVVWSETMA
jgi:hypothetical protein